MAASKSCIKFTTHEIRCPALRCKSVASFFLIVGAHRVRPTEAAPRRLSSTFLWSTLMSEPGVSFQHALPRQSLDRRLQWIQWFQWHQCAQYFLESLVRHNTSAGLDARRQAPRLQGGERQVGGGKDFVKTVGTSRAFAIASGSAMCGNTACARTCRKLGRCS